MTRLSTRNLGHAYTTVPVLDDLTVEIPDGRLTVVVGPNACGKSTLLRALARLLRPDTGAVVLDGKAVHEYPAREYARRLGLLPQQHDAPEGMTVAELVARGRHPHQGPFRQWSAADEAATARAMADADVTALAARAVDQLSGGQRQRVWLAMALAQRTDLLLLDEPTTYLDLAHQVEVLDLARRLVHEGRTVVAVLHELHLAFRYADHLVVMAHGRAVAVGAPGEIVTAALVEQVYGLACRIITDPVSGTPLVVPEATAALALPHPPG